MFQLKKHRSVTVLLFLGVFFVYILGSLITFIVFLLVTDIAIQLPNEIVFLFAYVFLLIENVIVFLLWRSFAIHHWQLPLLPPSFHGQ